MSHPSVSKIRVSIRQKTIRMHHLRKYFISAKIVSNFRNVDCVKSLVHFSTVESKTPIPSLSSPPEIKNPLVFDYLINTFDVPRNRALYVSNEISRSSSHSRLQIVPDFFKQKGFGDTQIRTIISRAPALIASNVEKILEPKLKCLEVLGFSGTLLADLIAGYPDILRSDIDRCIIPTIGFLRSLQLSNQDVVKALKRNNRLMQPEIRNNVKCNIEILHQCGVDNEQISSYLLHRTRLFGQNPEWFKGIVARADEFGVKRDSGVYIKAVIMMGCMSKESVEVKIELFKSYGCSELDIVSAFRKYPLLLAYSEQNIRTTMSFLLEEVGYEPKEIVFRPTLFGCSLEKVLKPRNEVLNLLIAEGLIQRRPGFQRVAVMSKVKFLQNYVIKYLDDVPNLQQVYANSQCLQVGQKF